MLKIYPVMFWKNIFDKERYFSWPAVSHIIIHFFRDKCCSICYTSPFVNRDIKLVFPKLVSPINITFIDSAILLIFYPIIFLSSSTLSFFSFILLTIFYKYKIIIFALNIIIFIFSKLFIIKLLYKIKNKILFLY